MSNFVQFFSGEIFDILLLLAINPSRFFIPETKEMSETLLSERSMLSRLVSELNTDRSDTPVLVIFKYISPFKVEIAFRSLSVSFSLLRFK